MKLVAASRLRRAQGLIAKSSFYSNNIISNAARVLYDIRQEEKEKNITYIMPELIRGNGDNKNYLLVVFTSDKGLCGSYNVNVAKVATKRIEELKSEGKNVKILCIGKKGKDILKRKYAEMILEESVDAVAKKGAKYYEAADISKVIMDLFIAKQINICEVVVSKFKSAINRDVIVGQILPVKVEEFEYNKIHVPTNVVRGSFYEYDPGKLEVLEGILPLIFKGSIFQAIIHSQASEHGARMTSMDAATNNATDMISKLSLKYNRIRQGAITTELTEIIAGAEAI